MCIALSVYHFMTLCMPQFEDLNVPHACNLNITGATEQVLPDTLSDITCDSYRWQVRQTTCKTSNAPERNPVFFTQFLEATVELFKHTPHALKLCKVLSQFGSRCKLRTLHLKIAEISPTQRPWNHITITIKSNCIVSTWNELI